MHRTSTTSTAYGETSSIDSGVVMIFWHCQFQLLTIATGDEMGVLFMCQHWKTLNLVSLS